MGGIKDPRKPSSHQLWHTWKGMLARCEYEKHPSFSNYGGRGITVCDRWRNDFFAFVSDMGNKPSPDHTVDRIDNDKGYEPGNVRWATWQEQNNNRRDNSESMTLNGVTRTVKEWCSETGLKAGQIRDRVKRGLSDAEVLLPPGQFQKKQVFNGVRYTISELAELAGVTRQCILSRMKKGLSFEEIIAPPRSRGVNAKE